MDAMSQAVEGAEVMLYGVCEAYKESANCRMEAQYAMQVRLDMIPLMLSARYKPSGWLGMIMGSRLHYPFHGAELDDQRVFDERIESVLREVGGRGKKVKFTGLTQTLGQL